MYRVPLTKAWGFLLVGVVLIPIVFGFIPSRQDPARQLTLLPAEQQPRINIDVQRLSVMRELDAQVDMAPAGNLVRPHARYLGLPHTLEGSSGSQFRVEHQCRSGVNDIQGYELDICQRFTFQLEPDLLVRERAQLRRYALRLRTRLEERARPQRNLNAWLASHCLPTDQPTNIGSLDMHWHYSLLIGTGPTTVTFSEPGVGSGKTATLDMLHRSVDLRDVIMRGRWRPYGEAPSDPLSEALHDLIERVLLSCHKSQPEDPVPKAMVLAAPSLESLSTDATPALFTTQRWHPVVDREPTREDLRYMLFGGRYRRVGGDQADPSDSKCGQMGLLGASRSGPKSFLGV